MDATLVLVRHGRTVPDPGRPAADWPLEDPEPCRALGTVLPDLPVVTSDEQKAIGTARALDRPFTTDSRLREVSRPWTGEDFDPLVALYLRGEHIEGWEPQEEVLKRFGDAATGIVVSHGTVMSLHVGAVTGLDAVEFWRQLRMPDAWALTDTGQLIRLATAET